MRSAVFTVIKHSLCISPGKPIPPSSDANHSESVIKVLVDQEIKIYIPCSGMNLFLLPTGMLDDQRRKQYKEENQAHCRSVEKAHDAQRRAVRPSKATNILFLNLLKETELQNLLSR